jgi:hypothetical protein
MLFLQTVSDRAKDKKRQQTYFHVVPGWLRFDISRYLGSDHHDLLRKAADMSDCDRVTTVALALSRVYLSCRDAFPAPQMKAVWEEAVWRQACATTGTNPDSFIPFEIVSAIPLK